MDGGRKYWKQRRQLTYIDILQEYIANIVYRIHCTRRNVCATRVLRRRQPDAPSAERVASVLISSNPVWLDRSCPALTRKSWRQIESSVRTLIGRQRFHPWSVRSPVKSSSATGPIVSMSSRLSRRSKLAIY